MTARDTAYRSLERAWRERWNVRLGWLLAGPRLAMVFPQASEQSSAERLLGNDLGGASTTTVAWERPGRDEYHDRSTPARCDLPCRLKPPDTRHANVHQYQVGPKTLGPLDALLATARSSNPFKPSRGADHRVGDVVERELVVDDQDPDRRPDRTQGRHCAMLTAPRPTVQSTRMCKWCEHARCAADPSDVPRWFEVSRRQGRCRHAAAGRTERRLTRPGAGGSASADRYAPSALTQEWCVHACAEGRRWRRLDRHSERRLRRVSTFSGDPAKTPVSEAFNGGRTCTAHRRRF
jgi:hypothetical protein